jgi:hypothetical protein
MVVSVEAGEESIQALRTTRRLVRVGPLAHQSDLTASSQGLSKSPVRVELDWRMSSSSAYSRRILIVCLYCPGIHPLDPSFDYERYLPSNRSTLRRKCFQTDQALGNCTTKLREMLRVEPGLVSIFNAIPQPPLRSHAENEQKESRDQKVLHNDTSTPRRSLTRFRSASQTILAAFRVFLIDIVLWLDGHVDDVRGIVVELQVYRRRVISKYTLDDSESFEAPTLQRRLVIK